MHLPLTTHGPSSAASPTAPSPYPQQAPPRPAPAPVPPRPQVRIERWEGTGFRPDIQGLRAIAVVLVLLSHAGFAFAAGGYVGVDVFFVLSGFLITSLLIKEVFDTGKISIAGFYARRARRILPAASVVTIATVIGTWLWFPITRFEAVMQDAFTVIVYVVNYRFVVESTEYLNADQMPSPFQQYWSLAVEEQFYLVWPLLLVCLLLMAKRVPRKALNAAIAACVAIFVLSLIASVLVTEASRPTAYYATHTRAWELAGGALLALTLPTWKKVPRFTALVLGVVGLAAIVFSGVRYTEATPFPGYTALLPVLGTMLVIVAGTARGKNPVSSLLSTGPFQFFGKISYSLYLWHWPILIIGPLALDAKPSLLLSIVLLAGTFAVAQFSYEYIETPIRTAKLLKGNFTGLATGLVCSLLGIAMVLALVVGFSKVPEDDGPVDLAGVEQVDGLEEVRNNLREGLEITSVPEGLQPSLTSVEDDRPSIYDEDGCHLKYEDVELPDGCLFGDTDSDKLVVLFGDSHAAQWFPALEMVAAEEGWSLLSRTKSSCTPVMVSLYNPQLERTYSECDEWRENVLDEFDELKPDLVILGTSDAKTLANGAEEEEGVGEWRAGWNELLDRVTAAAGHVVAMTDTPRSQDQSSPDCVALHQDSVQDCILNQDDAIRHVERREAGIAEQEAAGTTVIDTVEWFCVDGRCPPIVGEYLVMRDGNHISTPYVASLSTVLREALPEL